MLKQIIRNNALPEACDNCGAQVVKYAMTSDGKRLCFDCVAKDEANSLAELEYGETMTLLFINGEITDKTRTLQIPVTRYSEGSHNYAGKRTNIWFEYAGNSYHAIQTGNSQVASIKKLKPKKQKTVAVKITPSTGKGFDGKISEKDLWPDESFKDEPTSNE